MSEKKKVREGFGGLLGKKGRTALLLLAAAVGILLLFLGSGTETKGQESESLAFEEEGLAELSEYKEKLEEELEALCASAAGVSQVDVMVTLANGTRIVYATDREGKPVSVGSGSAQKPLYRTVEPPTVSGVGVVCSTALSAEREKELMELVSSALGIGKNKIFIIGVKKTVNKS